MVRCRQCDHCYLNPRPAPADLGTIYPADYYAYVDEEERGGGLVAILRRRWEGGKTQLFREQVGEGRRRILDVGCGSGRFLSILRDFGSPAWELEGVDFDEGALARCEARGFRVHRGRVEDLSGDVERFDAVVMLQLIEHVEDPAKICERVFELLAPGGCFIIETPNLGGLDYALFRGQVWGHYHFPRHWNLFSSAALRRMLEERGFEIQRTDYLISTSAWILSLHNRAKVRGYPAWALRFFHFRNPLLLGLFIGFDWLRARLGMETSNQRMIARRPTR